MKRILPLLLLLSLQPASACITPVYRYALENWPADPYRVSVLYRGSLGPEGERLVERLRSASELANIYVETVDLSGNPGNPPTEGKLPRMVVRYPAFMEIEEPLWSAPLTEGNVEKLLRSPLRDEIARHIIEGATAVWVLVESGEDERDKEVERLLREELRKMERALEPDLEEYESYLESLGMPMDLKARFPLVRLSRGDPEEALLLRMLFPPGLLEGERGPIAFPVFGRGRVLCALVGDELNELNIEDVCAFLIGGCTCQVKGMCPGWDLLISADWEAAVEGMFAEEAGFAGSLRRNLIIVLSAQLAAIAIGTWALLWRRRKAS